MRSRLRLIGKKIALARRLVSLLTCTQHLRLKYRIHAGLSLYPSLSFSLFLALPLSLFSLVQTSLSCSYFSTSLLIHPPTCCNILPLLSFSSSSSSFSFFSFSSRAVFHRLWPVHQPFLHDPAHSRNSQRHRVPMIPRFPGYRSSAPCRCCSSRKTR